MPEENPYLVNPRWAVAEQVAEAARQRFAAGILAIGVHGPLAHGDDNEASDVDLLVITNGDTAGPRPGTRRVSGVIVDLGVVDAHEYLRHVRTLSTSWPLAADRYMSTVPIYDPHAWLVRMRDTHLARLADASGPEFTALAREAWCRAASAHARATRLAEWYETDAALVVLAEARLSAAMVAGLLARTYFRDSADAVTRAGVAGADLAALGAVLRGQAEELASRGRPVDAAVAELFA